MAEKSIKRNTTYVTIKNFFAVFLPFVTFPYVSRVLSPEGLGKINFAQSIVGYLSFIATLGISTYAIRLCSSYRNDKHLLEEAASQIFSINLICTGIAYVAMVVSFLLFNKLDDYRVLISILSISIFFTTLGAEWINSAFEEFGFITIRTIGVQVVSLILVFVFIHNSNDYIKYAVILVISASGANILNVVHRRKFCKIHLTTRLNLKKHAIHIATLFAMILSQQILYAVDTTLLGVMKGDYEVGIYSAASKIVSVIISTVTSLGIVSLPRLSYYFSNSEFDSINKLLGKALKFYVTIGLPIACGIIMVAEDVIIIVSGNQYVESAPVLRMLILTFLVSLLGSNYIGNMVLLPSGEEKKFMIITCITAAVNFILDIILIAKIGTIGAALTTVLSQILMLILLLACVDKRVKISLGKSLYSSGAGCIFIVGVCYFINQLVDIRWLRLGLNVIICILLYGGVCLLLKNEVVLDLYKDIRKLIHRTKNDRE